MNTFHILKIITLLTLCSTQVLAADRTATTSASQEKAIVLPQIVVIGKRLSQIEKIRLTQALLQDRERKEVVVVKLAGRKG